MRKLGLAGDLEVCLGWTKECKGGKRGQEDIDYEGPCKLYAKGLEKGS